MGAKGRQARGGRRGKAEHSRAQAGGGTETEPTEKQSESRAGAGSGTKLEARGGDPQPAAGEQGQAGPTAPLRRPGRTEPAGTGRRRPYFEGEVMDAGAGRAGPEQQQPQRDRDPPQRSPTAAGRHVYSSISILFPRHFRGQGGGHVTGRGRPALLSPPGPPVTGAGLPSPATVSRRRRFSPSLEPFWALPAVPRPELPAAVRSAWRGPLGEAPGRAPASLLAQGGRWPQGTA